MNGGTHKVVDLNDATLSSIERGTSNPKKSYDTGLYDCGCRTSRQTSDITLCAYHAGMEYGVNVTRKKTAAVLRDEFLKLLTVPVMDRRRRDHNVPLFQPETDGGRALWDEPVLADVMEKYDRAVQNIGKEGH
jgi:hypothetical protein